MDKRDEVGEHIHHPEGSIDVDDDDTPCECGHEKDDHLVRLDVTGNVYGACNGSTSNWGHRCICREYEAEQ